MIDLQHVSHHARGDPRPRPHVRTRRRRLRRPQEACHAPNRRRFDKSAEQVERETEKAIGVQGTYWNSYANAKPGTAWIPKSQIKQIGNDYWINPDQASRFYLVPTWLINAKKAEGYEI